MSSNSMIEDGTRSMLDMTLRNITQLDATLKYHLEQEQGILSQIKSLEFTLSELKQKHAQVNASIRTIRQSVANVKEAEQHLRNALAPMRRLPDDTLLHIFRILVDMDDRSRCRRAATWVSSSNADRNLQLRLGRVCRRWKRIMNENSSLWTTVEIHLDSGEGVPDQEHQRFLHWTKAGKQREQTIYIDNWKLHHNAFLGTLLGKESTEWKAVHMSTLEDPAAGFCGSYSAREVTICRSDLETSRYFAPLMRQASALVIYGPPPEWGDLPWIRLRNLTIKQYAVESGADAVMFSFGHLEFTSLLVAATELAELALDFPVDEDTLTAETSVSITHRNLTRLSLHLHHFVAGKGPFSVILNTPSLQTLELISLQARSYVNGVPFVCHWDAPKTLSLPAMDDDEVPLAVGLTRWLPNVQKLEVVGDNVDALFTFFHSLFHHIPPHSLPLSLPKLDSIFVTDTDLRGETLIELLESRLRHVRGNTDGVCAITDIKMYNSPAVTVAHWRRVQELLSEGAKGREMVVEDDMGRSARGT